MSNTITDKKGNLPKSKLKRQIFGHTIDELSPSERATAITGYDLRTRIEALVAGVTGKKINTMFHGTGACTGEDIMILPSIPQTRLFLKNEAMTLLGYAAHEISHQLETDFDLIPGIFQDINKPTKKEIQLKEWWNAIEDYRIEKITRREFPGFPIYIGATRHYTADRFVTAVNEGLYQESELNNPYRIGAVGLTWVGAILNGYPTKAHDEALSLLGDELEGWLRSLSPRLSAVETKSDALQLARELLDELEQASQQKDDSESSQSDNSDESDQSDSNNTCQQEPSSGENQTEGNDQGGEADQSQDKGKSESENANDSNETKNDQTSSDDGSNRAESSDDEATETKDESDSGGTPSEGNESPEGDDRSGSEEGESDEKNSEHSGDSGQDDDSSAESEEENSGDNDSDTSSDSADNSNEIDSSQTTGEEEVGEAGENPSEDSSNGSSASSEDMNSGEVSDSQNSDENNGDEDQDTGNRQDQENNATNEDDDVRADTEQGTSTSSPSKGSSSSAPAPQTDDDDKEANPEESDLKIEEILEAMSKIADQFDNAPTNLENDPCGVEKEVIRRSQKKYATIKRQLGSPAARTAGIMRRLLMAKNRTNTRRNLEQGRLDLKRLVPIANGSPNVYYEKNNRKDVNSAVSILVDNSGSMGGEPLLVCQKASIILDYAINGTGTDLEILGFTGSVWNPTIYQYRKFGQKGQAAAASLGSMDEVNLGGTPTSTPILESHRRLMAHKAPRKIMIIITDGHADDPERTKEAHDIAVATGCLVFGIGIGSYGQGIAGWCANHQIIMGINELPNALSAIVQAALNIKTRKAA